LKLGLPNTGPGSLPNMSRLEITASATATTILTCTQVLDQDGLCLNEVAG
jgi:hypothetical protein